jgi:hypothetical protein
LAEINPQSLLSKAHGMNRVTVRFIMDDVLIDDGIRQSIRQNTGEWESILHAGSRQIIDAVVDPAVIPTAQALLAPYGPVIVGVWNEDGTPYDLDSYPFDLTEYSTMGLEVEHQFGGWGERSWL